MQPVESIRDNLINPHAEFQVALKFVSFATLCKLRRYSKLMRDRIALHIAHPHFKLSPEDRNYIIIQSRNVNFRDQLRCLPPAIFGTIAGALPNAQVVMESLGDHPPALFALAHVYLSVGNMTGAFNYCRRAAYRGHAEANYILADFYFQGRGVAKQEELAWQHYHTAADANHLGAMAAYGARLFSLRYPGQAAGIPTLLSGAMQGHAICQRFIGEAYSEDPAQLQQISIPFLTRAALQQDIEALVDLGRIYMTARNYKMALTWLDQALHHPQATPDIRQLFQGCLALYRQEQVDKLNALIHKIDQLSIQH